LLANKILSSYHLTKQVKQAQSGTTTYHLTTSLERLIGGQDLWGRIDSFLLYSNAEYRSPSTLRTYRYILGLFVRFVNELGITMPEQVKEEHIVAYIVHKKETCGGVSINTYYKHLRAWFNWMVQRKIISESPCAILKSPTLPKTVIRPLGNDELQRMLACCPNYFHGIRDKAIILLIYDSGLRRSEVSNIKLDDIDLNRGSIKVMGKGAKERYVAIGEETKKAIVAYLYLRKDNLAWLFITQLKDKPGKMQPDSITQMIEKIMTRAGIVGAKKGPHTLRHSFATASIRNGANLFYVQSLLGHSTLNMTRRYAATVDSEEAVKNHKSFSPADRLKK